MKTTPTRMEVPKAVMAISHNGASYAPDPDGTVTVPAAAAEALLPHGLRPKPEDPAPAQKRKTKG